MRLTGSLILKFRFRLAKNAREKFEKWPDKVKFGRWRDSFSSTLCFVLKSTLSFLVDIAQLKTKPLKTPLDSF